MLLAGSATSIEAFRPYALSHLINAITAAAASHVTFMEAILPWVALLGALWFGATFCYRAYEALDVQTSPRVCVASASSSSLPRRSASFDS